MRILMLLTALLAMSLPVRALEVLTTIKPLGFIAAAITDGVTTPVVLLPAGASPHEFALRPSDIRSINKADLVVWVGPELEGFMAKPLARHPHVLTLTTLAGMPLFNYGQPLGAHQDQADKADHDGDHDGQHGDTHSSHQDHADKADHDAQHGDTHSSHQDHADEADHDGQHGDTHSSHQDHADEADHDAQHGDTHSSHQDHADEADHDAQQGDTHSSHQGHSHVGIDPHLWLGPTQARVIARAVSEALSQQDPANADRYRANLQAFEAKVEAKDKAIAEQMKLVQQRGYFVFHEAYGYWERHYGMRAKGHFTVSPDRRPGAKTLVAIRQALTERAASCIYAEPQFSPAVIDSVARNTGAKVLLLDEVGEQVPLGPDGYPQFMQQLADAFAQCN